MDGEEALAYSRMRKHPQGGGDRGRGQRQQQVIEGIIKKAASFSSITKFDDVLDAIGDNLNTNLSFPNMLALHGYATSLNEIETIQLEGEDTRIDGVYYMLPNEENLLEVQSELKQHLDLEKAEEQPENNITSF